MAIVDFNSPIGKQLLKNLYAYSRGLYSELYRAEVNEKGKSYTDYVHQALDMHLRGKDNYDPNQAPLEYHLKFHVIKRELHNDLPTHVKKAYRERIKIVDPDKFEMVHIIPEPAKEKEPAEDILDFTEHDQKLIFSEIEKEINGDDIVERIYLAVAHDKFNLSDRAEICKECDITHSDFDNGKRRFITILKRVFKKLQLTQTS
ncbi:MAG: hypothetical protein JNM78_06120 [Cyclobacteriaceae bacterium]|nr:hypothetical protein [Cyclobacteriaceae bacterium]